MRVILVFRLQVLSGILSASTSDGNKGEERAVSSSAVTETHASPVGSTSVSQPALTTTEDIQPRETSLGKVQATMKIPLADLTNKLTRQQMSAHVLKGQLYSCALLNVFLFLSFFGSQT